MTIDTVAVTGGSGLIGGAIVDELNDNGYRTVNLDRRRADDCTADEYRRTDLLDAGQTYGSLARCDADAVVHMGTIVHPRNDPGYVTYESNVQTTYHVLEAAMELELEAACLASSINAIGWSYQDVPPDVRYLPIDEEHPATPRDPYALGKRVIEVTADGFGRLDDSPRTISTLRFPGVRSDEEVAAMADDDRSLEAFEKEYDPEENPVFTYVHVADAASMARRAIEAEFEGHETFWSVAADTTAAAPTADLLETFYPDIEVRFDPSGHEGLISVDKARRLLDWEAEHTWRDR
ncbi:NAD-dependent epimerase/dehydratase family protein [Halomontanus rarus]|uniref:NAD-dependent epimerase/dehydratase family protein n=1 Tax=Halomontanus rarus TaxID=3034020 RepID=UPI0023E88171|nr:NAD(P)-dependent oxidoreductase [Halovivax sp. TS33]